MKRDKFYTFYNLPLLFSFNETIIQTILESRPSIGLESLRLATETTKKDIEDWLNNEIGINNFKLDNKIKLSTKDPNDIINNILEGEINLTLYNPINFLQKTKLNNQIIEKLNGPIKVTLGQNFKVRTEADLSKSEQIDLLNCLEYFFRTPAFKYLGDEYMPQKFFKSVVQLNKKEDSENNKQIIIKSSNISRRDVYLMELNNEEYTIFKSKVEIAKLKRHLKGNLKENTSVKRKMKL